MRCNAMTSHGPRSGLPWTLAVSLTVVMGCRTAEVQPSELRQQSQAAVATPDAEVAAIDPAKSVAVPGDEARSDDGAPPPNAPSTAIAPRPEAEGTMAPLTEEQLAVLHGSAEDDVPEHRGGVVPSVENKHYLSGNEDMLDAFHGDLAGVGGAYVGVGTDQGYLFLSWARFELAWFIDYDPAIQQIHEIYRLLFSHAATPEAFIALWDAPARDEVNGIIDAAHPQGRAKQLRYWYRNARGRIHGRLLRTRRRMTGEGIASYLDDQEHYDYVRLMLEQRRIRPLLVNLLADRGLQEIGRSSEALGVPIRVLYLSNAEQYWKRYSPQYRANIAGLPFADDAVVIRTLTSKDINDDYRYNVHPVANYRRWLERPYIGTVYQVVHAGPKSRPEGITHFVTDGDPDDSPAARRYRAKHAQ